MKVAESAQSNSKRRHEATGNSVLHRPCCHHLGDSAFLVAIEFRGGVRHGHVFGAQLDPRKARFPRRSIAVDQRQHLRWRPASRQSADRSFVTAEVALVSVRSHARTEHVGCQSPPDSRVRNGVSRPSTRDVTSRGHLCRHRGSSLRCFYHQIDSSGTNHGDCLASVGLGFHPHGDRSSHATHLHRPVVHRHQHGDSQRTSTNDLRTRSHQWRVRGRTVDR